MKMFGNFKVDIFKILIGTAFCLLAFLSIYVSQQSKLLEIDSEGLTYIESLNVGVQRTAKLVLEGSSDVDLMISMEGMYNELDPINGKYFTRSEELIPIIQNYLADMKVFQQAVVDFRESGARDNLFRVSENIYNNSEEVSLAVNLYIEEQENNLVKTENILIGHIVAIAMLLVKILFNTHKELKENKEISKEMFIDTSTGLYNRSKCQEILKNKDTIQNMKEKAIIIFDLNDLKKTNDGLGHRAGDDLIACFAAQLKHATNIFQYEIFTGRYGGDEFMVYFSSTVEQDVELYIEEVEYLMDEFNEKDGKPFKLSCAAGYSITNEETKSMTMRELFDAADETMYKNKLAMKEKKRQEQVEKGMIVPDIVDDRLL